VVLQERDGEENRGWKGMVEKEKKLRMVQHERMRGWKGR
jgi:hypothetical protein